MTTQDPWHQAATLLSEQRLDMQQAAHSAQMFPRLSLAGSRGGLQARAASVFGHAAKADCADFAI